MRRRLPAAALGLALGAAIVVVAASPAAAATRLIPSGGTTAIRATPTGAEGVQVPETRPSDREENEDAGDARPRPGFKDGIFPKKPLEAPEVRSSEIAGSNPEVAFSFEGLNHRDQRLANGGNQFSLEPPDQGLCVGNGFTVEATNSVLRVFSSATGKSLAGVQDLNTFFGYAAAINRTTGSIGPEVIDPVCHFDPDNQRFVVAITTLFVDENGDFNGKNSIDLAVSNSGDPTGLWTIYHVAAQNDGTDGTPNHGCTTDGKTPGPCFQDYPHIGADKNGVYISTNEYDLFGPSYQAAQVFSFSKQQLAQHPFSIGMTLVENLRLEGTPGFTVWPATSPAGQYSNEQNGTEFFLSTIAGDGSETGNPTGTARRIGLWALTNTSSLNSPTPALVIASRTVKSETYVFPPTANQKTGDIPLGECLNDKTPFDPHPEATSEPCWFLFFDPPPTWQPEVESRLDANDTRMQQVWFTNGILWGANDTAVRVKEGRHHSGRPEEQLTAGIAWFAVKPKLDRKGKVEGDIKKQGYLALANNHLTYPALAMTTDGKGVIAFTIVGDDFFPSAGYALISSDGDVGPIHVVGQGLGPSDGFTSYKAFVGDPPRTRWGDYGAAVTDGSVIWIASEYIAQTCTLEQYLTGAIGSCGATRTALANWSTRVSKLNP
jgi:hypothetical protein